MATPDIIDLSTFRDLKDLMGPDLGDLIDTYTTETRDVIARLRQALAAGDAEAFRRLAHSIKSSSASLGALSFSQQARDLEMVGKSGDLSGAGPGLDALAAGFLHVKENLEALKNEP